MPQRFLFVLFCLCASAVSAQRFDWLSSGKNVELNVTHATITSSRKMLVVAEGSSPYYINGPQKIFTNQKKDSSIVEIASKKTYPVGISFLISYAADGKIDQFIEFQNKWFRIYGLERNSKNEFLMLCYVEGEYDLEQTNLEREYRTGSDNDEDEQEEEEISYGNLDLFQPLSPKDQFVRAGLYVLVLDESIHLKSSILIAPEEHLGIEPEGFLVNAQDKLVIFGHFDDQLDMEAFKAVPKKAGGDFVFVYDQQGKWLWGDLAAYEGTSCCSSYSDAQHVSISPNGSVYMGGSASKTVHFSNGKTLESPAKGDKNGLRYGTYLVAYHPDGKIRWVKQTDAQNIIQQTVATDKQVIIAYQNGKSIPQPFEVTADTSANRHSVLAAFSNSGKFLWSVTEGASCYQRLTVSGQTLYAFGTSDHSVSSKQIGNYTLKKLERSYVSYYSTDGKFRGVVPLKPDADYKPQPTYFFPVSAHEMYLAYSTFLSLSVPLRVFDELYGDLKGNAHIGVIGKIHY